MRSPDEAGQLRVEARQRLLSMRAGQPAPVRDLRQQVRHVVVLASSSRGGSSVMAEILRNSRNMLHFRAEVNPFLALAGYAWPESGVGDDSLGAEDLGDPTSLEQLLAHDIGGHTGTLPGPDAVYAFAQELHWRLSLQWPVEHFEPGWVLEQVQDTLQVLEGKHGWARGTFPEAGRFHALFLSRIRRRHPAVNPWYYDLPPQLIREHCPGCSPCDAPPSPVVLEEPPFVTVSPWSPATAQQLASLPVVVKTPSNAYRLPFLQALFPNARIRVLHLTRNAAASVNGLVDGWRFRGFFAHRSDLPLDIAGYSDHFPPWAQHWWKFDLPPGWRAWTRQALVEVCGFQWRSAHRATLDWVRAQDADSLTLRFEHVVGHHPQRIEAFERLADWLGLPGDPTLQRLVEAGLPPIMATSRPRHRRWYDRAALLEPVLVREETRAIMEELGYAADPATWL
jgi:hypothetical protein